MFLVHPRVPHAVRTGIIENPSRRVDLAHLIGFVVFFVRLSQMRGREYPPCEFSPYSYKENSGRPRVIPNYPNAVCNTR